MQFPTKGGLVGVKVVTSLRLVETLTAYLVVWGLGTNQLSEIGHSQREE